MANLKKIRKHQLSAFESGEHNMKAFLTPKQQESVISPIHMKKSERAKVIDQLSYTFSQLQNSENPEENLDYLLELLRKDAHLQTILNDIRNSRGLVPIDFTLNLQLHELKILGVTYDQIIAAMEKLEVKGHDAQMTDISPVKVQLNQVEAKERKKADKEYLNGL